MVVSFGDVVLSSSSKSSLKESSRALVVHKNDDDFAFFLGKRHFFKGPLFFYVACLGFV